MPALGEVQRVARKQRRRLDIATKDEELGHILGRFYEAGDDEDDEVMTAIRERVSESIDVENYDDDAITAIWELYNTYSSRLRSICFDNSLTSAMLTEEEVVVHTRLVLLCVLVLTSWC